MEEIWIDEGAKMEPQGDTELSGRMDRTETGKDEELKLRGRVQHTLFFYFTKPPQLFSPLIF